MTVMTVTPLALHGCLLLERRVHLDARGSFSKPYQRSVFEEAGLPHRFDEQFLSRSAYGVVRGLHLQVPPAEQWKMVTCVSGAIRDVLLDVRTLSPTYRAHETLQLESDQGRAVLIPPGVAHGFVSLAVDSVVGYWVTAEHDAASDTGVRWDSAGIDWRLESTPRMSERDAVLPALDDFVNPFTGTVR